MPIPLRSIGQPVRAELLREGDRVRFAPGVFDQITEVEAPSVLTRMYHFKFADGTTLSLSPETEVIAQLDLSALFQSA